ncbi:MAG TPA: sugar porter family MFS transporter [Tepidisphaeraceae bacterium]|nr:sugar porter family MFS transporter [Tepidisphaeraceae bacterium]
MITGTNESAVSGSAAKINLTYVWIISSVAAMGGLLFGYDWVVIGGAAPFYQAFFHLSDKAAVSSNAGFWEQMRSAIFSETGWAQSCALLGCLVGALFSGTISDRFGRKPILIISAIIFLGSSIGNTLCQSFTAFVGWRFLGGVGIGLASTISPMYISEIAPARIRGVLVAVNQLTIVVGILAAQFINWCIGHGAPAILSQEASAQGWYEQSAWRWMFGACAVPSALFFLTSLFVPESPRWLVKAGNKSRATHVLGRIGGQDYSSAEIANIQASLANEDRHVRFRELLDPSVLAALGIGIFLAVFQQWCGINVIFNYAAAIFKDAGYDISGALQNIVATGLVNLLFTFVAMFTVDRLGRKPLMLFGAAALTVIYALIGYGYYVKAGGGQVPGILFLVLVLCAIAAYAMSLAPVTWVIMSEIFPNRIRGTAMSISVAFLWLACFLLTYTFPIFNAQLGPAWTFWIYAGVCVIGFLFVLAKVSETKGKTLEQIEKEQTLVKG